MGETQPSQHHRGVLEKDALLASEGTCSESNTGCAVKVVHSWESPARRQPELGPNTHTSLPQSNIGAQTERGVNWIQTQDLAQVQFLPEIGLIDCRGHDKTTRVPEKAVVMARATRSPGLRQARQTLNLGVAAAALMGRRMQDKERRFNNSDGQDTVPPMHMQAA